MSITSATCGMGYTNRKPDVTANQDCRENNASVNPGQASYFTSGYCKTLICLPSSTLSYDYNCNGVEEKQYGVSSSTCPGAKSAFACAARTGFVTTAPACGASGTFRQCVWNKFTGVCTGTETSKTQACR
jgi:hypothetical protein